jgi:hypothetical protein
MGDRSARARGAAALGVDQAIRHATGWAIDPLVDWLNTNVADLNVPVGDVQTGTGKVTKSVTEFLVGFIPALKGMRALGATGKVAAAHRRGDRGLRDEGPARSGLVTPGAAAVSRLRAACSRRPDRDAGT